MPTRSKSPAGARTPPTAHPGGATGEAPAQSTGAAPDYRVEALAKGLRILSLFSERRPTWRV